MKKPTKKILEAAKNFLYAEARFRAWDNHDDMNESENWKHTFDFLVNHKVTVYDFIKQHLPDEIQKAKDEAVEGYDPEHYEGVFDGFDEVFGV